MKYPLLRKLFFRMNQGGFTLTELMIVVSIIGILGASMVSSYFAMRPTKNLHSDSREFISQIQLMKLEAIKRNVCVGLTFTPEIPPAIGFSYTIFIDDGGAGIPANVCNAVFDAGEQRLRNIRVKPGVVLALSPVGPIGDPFAADLFSAISLNPRGLLETRLAAGSYVLRNSVNAADASLWARVVIRNAGDATIQTSDDPTILPHWSR